MYTGCSKTRLGSTAGIYGYMTEKFWSVGAKAIDFQNFFMEINLLSLCTCLGSVCVLTYTGAV